MFLILRTVYGIGMGGEWGVGASLALKALHVAGNSFRNSLQTDIRSVICSAALAAHFVGPAPLGMARHILPGGAPALLAFLYSLPGFANGSSRTAAVIVRAASGHWKVFFLSGSVDDAHDVSFAWHPGSVSGLPENDPRGTPRAVASNLAILYNIGAVLGAIVFGHFSEGLGRRRSMIAALLLSLAVISALGASLATRAGSVLDAGSTAGGSFRHISTNFLPMKLVIDAGAELSSRLGILAAADTMEYERPIRNMAGLWLPLRSRRSRF